MGSCLTLTNFIVAYCMECEYTRYNLINNASSVVKYGAELSRGLWFVTEANLASNVSIPRGSQQQWATLLMMMEV
jgi:hypothetical protein